MTRVLSEQSMGLDALADDAMRNSTQFPELRVLTKTEGRL